MPTAAIRPPRAAYAAPWAGVVPASPGWATQAPGRGRDHRTMPADWQARLVQGRASDAGPGTTAIATRMAMNDARPSRMSGPRCLSRPRPSPMSSPRGRLMSRPRGSRVNGQPRSRIREPGVTSMSPIGPVRFSRGAA